MPLTEAEILRVPPSVYVADILQAMNMDPARRIMRRLVRLVDETVSIAHAHAQPRVVWRRGTPDAILEALPKSSRLCRYVESADHVYLMAGTSGQEWETCIHEESDPMRALVYSAAATALARQTLNFTCEELVRRFPQLTIADAISPGTDGLPFSMQSTVAELLPLSDIGIAFDNETLLMSPAASVTAIIAVGSSEGTWNLNRPAGESSNCVLAAKPARSETHS